MKKKSNIRDIWNKLTDNIFCNVVFMVIVTVFGIIVLMGCVMSVNWVVRDSLNVAPFGPEITQQVTIERLYVDVSGESSHYMVGTDKGVFEVNNSMWLGIWNADEAYSKLQTGKTYTITTKGVKLLDWWIQQYPLITKIE